MCTAPAVNSKTLVVHRVREFEHPRGCGVWLWVRRRVRSVECGVRSVEAVAALPLLGFVRWFLCSLHREGGRSPLWFLVPGAWFLVPGEALFLYIRLCYMAPPRLRRGVFGGRELPLGDMAGLFLFSCRAAARKEKNALKKRAKNAAQKKGGGGSE